MMMTIHHDYPRKPTSWLVVVLVVWCGDGHGDACASRWVAGLLRGLRCCVVVLFGRGRHWAASRRPPAAAWFLSAFLGRTARVCGN